MEKSKEVLSNELKTFEIYFKEAVRSSSPLLDRIMQYIVKRKGKQLRPMFVLLSARLCGEVTDASYRAASLVEILHTATLVHDDVVDDSFQRRGFFSAYALWKAKAAVLIGDYLLAKGLLISLQYKDYEILHILSEAVKKMSEGELLQMEKSRSLNISENVYYEIIKNKTASLLASACAAGARSATQNPESVQILKQFGEHAGLAFQIKDDLFDYTSQKIGKPTGNDIKEKKITLPLIYTLQNVDYITRRKMIYILKNENRNPEKVSWVIKKVKEKGGITYAENKMLEFKNKALELLSRFKNDKVRQAMEELVSFVTDREY
ncbi:MAG: polyprenyl synthetase family protein [Chitinophagaceae bacterium]|nr:polyprenyl synthetase family protein [Chitinophagaceae bacterium]